MILRLFYISPRVGVSDHRAKRAVNPRRGRVHKPSCYPGGVECDAAMSEVRFGAKQHHTM